MVAHSWSDDINVFYNSKELMHIGSSVLPRTLVGATEYCTVCQFNKTTLSEWADTWCMSFNVAK